MLQVRPNTRKEL